MSGSPIYPFPFVNGPVQDVRFVDLRKLLKVLAWAAERRELRCGRCCEGFAAAGDDALSPPLEGCLACLARELKATLDARTKARRLKNRQEGSIAAIAAKGQRRRVPSARG